MRTFLSAACAFLAIAVMTALATLALHAQTAGPPSVMIIFDGSGSMWGRLDGDKKAKVDLAREALRVALAKMPASVRSGLMSFGHRRSGDCSDIEVMVPVGEGDGARIMTPLDKFNPRGKGPITGAIREAAKALGSNPAASIVLIHDNADNCRQDPCEAAAEIAESSPKLKIHLVPLGLDPDELERSVCIAKITGGQVFDVKDAAGVPTAIGAAIALAIRDGGGGGDPPAAVGGPTIPQPGAGPIAGPPGLRLEAKLGAKPVPAGSPVHWRVVTSGSKGLDRPAGAAGYGEPAPVFEGSGNAITVPLEPGSYDIEARAGFASARASATVAGKGPTPVEVPLEAAAVRLAVTDLKDGTPSSTAMVTLRSGNEAGAVARPLWVGPVRDADFVLPAGGYRVHITDSLVERDETLTLAAGDIAIRPIVLGAGHLELSAVAKPDGAPLDGVTFLLARDDPDAPGGRREIARSAAVRPTFTLPAGTYYVTARTGPAEVRQRVGIGAGDNVKQTLVLGLAKLSVSADVPASAPAGPGTTAPVRPTISTRVLSLGGEVREIARSTAVAPEFTLAAGRYRVEAAIGTLNVKAVQDVDIEAGSNRRVALKLDSGTMTLKLATPALVSSGLTWEVRDGKGALVVRTQQSTPRLILAPGRYTARCEIDDRRIEKTIEITTDTQPRVIEFAMP